MLRFTLNGQTVETDLTPDTPLLWAVRDQFKLKGSKFGCGAGLVDPSPDCELLCVSVP